MGDIPNQRIRPAEFPYGVGVDERVEEIIDENTDPNTAAWLKTTLAKLGLYNLRLISGLTAVSNKNFAEKSQQFLTDGTAEGPIEYDLIAPPLLKLEEVAKLLEIRPRTPKVEATNTKPNPLVRTIYCDRSHRLNGLMLARSRLSDSYRQWSGYQVDAAVRLSMSQSS